MTTIEQPQVIDRSAARAEIAARLNREAQAKGYADHDAELDDDYAQWRERTHAR